MAEQSEEIVQRIRTQARAGKRGLVEDWASIWPEPTATALMAAEAENERLRELLYQALTEGGIPPADYAVYLNHDTGQAFLSAMDVDCPDCHGTGDIAQAVDPSDVVGCPRCDSTGRIEKARLFGSSEEATDA